MSTTAIVWSRHDLRLDDNPALAAAATRSHRLVPLYVLDDEDRRAWWPGGAARWRRHPSLAALDESLQARSG
jgi:deoxyribodipyrimidine photo-lyase